MAHAASASRSTRTIPHRWASCLALTVGRPVVTRKGYVGAVDLPGGAVELLHVGIAHRPGVPLALHHHLPIILRVGDNIGTQVPGATAHLHPAQPVPTHQPSDILLEQRTSHTVGDRNVAIALSLLRGLA